MPYHHEILCLLGGKHAADWTCYDVDNYSYGSSDEMTTIQMTLDEELLKEVDGTVKRLRTTRSALIRDRSEEHTSELQSLAYLVCRLLLEKKKRNALDGRFLSAVSGPRGEPEGVRATPRRLPCVEPYAHTRCAP